MTAVVAEQRAMNPPSSTVYVKNLEERIKPDQLKGALTEIFSEYGNIVDLVTKKNLKAKGQAFIVFDGVEAAERAIEEVQGFELFEKPMVLDYAKTKSDATVQREGNEEEFEAHKRRRLAEKGASTIMRGTLIVLIVFQNENKQLKQLNWLRN
ncbi:MAG: hypothetical protein Q9217_006370 [Psora testacea]